MKKLIVYSVLFLFCCTNLHATTIIPYTNMGILSQHCDAVVVATAVEAISTHEGDATWLDMRFEVALSLKGTLSTNQSLVVRPLSHSSSEYQINIAGDFHPVERKRYLLFLNSKNDYWRPECLSYYVFEEVIRGNDRFWSPILGNQAFFVLPNPDQIEPEPRGVFHARALTEALQQYVADPTVWLGRQALSSLAISDVVDERALPTGCDFDLNFGSTTQITRWQNANVVFLHNTTNAPATIAARMTNVNNTLNTNYTGIDPVYNGAVTFTPNCIADGSSVGSTYLSFCNGQPSGIRTSLVQFDDPCDEMGSLSGCNGVLGFGGSYSSSQTHTYKAQSWFNALYGFIVVNVGTFGCLSTANFEIFLTHESTHIFNMDHLDAVTYPGSNMNLSCCNAISAKDRECMNYTYDIALPIELADFRVVSLQDRQVEAIWDTHLETNGGYFTVYHATDGLHFSPINSTPDQEIPTGAHYSYIHDIPATGLNYYRLAHTDRDGQEQFLGIRKISLAGAHSYLQVSPNPASATEQLVVTLQSDKASQSLLEMTDSRGVVVYQRLMELETGKNTCTIPTEVLPKGLYLLTLSNESSKETKKVVLR